VSGSRWSKLWPIVAVWAHDCLGNDSSSLKMMGKLFVQLRIVRDYLLQLRGLIFAVFVEIIVDIAHRLIEPSPLDMT
jgi:hypothetical protein